MNELIINAEIENMDAVQDFVAKHIGDCPPKIRNQIMIAVDEIFSNIARYAYNQAAYQGDTTAPQSPQPAPAVGGAVVRISADNVINGGDITIEFEDNGVEYNPLSGEDPDISLSADEREIGGLGIFMVKNIMDSVTYHRDGNKNILTIKKKL